MLSNGVVRPSSSPWASRVILVQKKDGAKRFVIDFRALNDCTKKDAYPLPDIRDILDKLDSSQFFLAASFYTAVYLYQEGRSLELDSGL